MFPTINPTSAQIEAVFANWSDLSLLCLWALILTAFRVPGYTSLLPVWDHCI